MRETVEATTFESAVRAAWAELVSETLPAAARARRWPVAAPDCFERILLDHVRGSPSPGVASGRWGSGAGLLDLILAIEIADRILCGAACPVELNRRSLAMRAAGSPPARDPASTCQNGSGLGAPSACATGARRGRRTG